MTRCKHLCFDIGRTIITVLEINKNPIERVEPIVISSKELGSNIGPDNQRTISFVKILITSMVISNIYDKRICFCYIIYKNAGKIHCRGNAFSNFSTPLERSFSPFRDQTLTNLFQSFIPIINKSKL